MLQWERNTLMAIPREHWITAEQYHQIEEEHPNCKFEYANGQVYAMAGGKFSHSRIAVTIVSILDTYLLGKRCQVANSDMHVLPAGKEDPSYLPDVTVTCTPEDYADDSLAILQPRLIFEVLSPSTILRDQNEKRFAYQACPSMQEYVMVSTDRRELEVYRRGVDDQWRKTVYTAQATLPLLTIGLDIPVSTIYRGTAIPPLDS
jgi:Uma2 family endonuclease